MTTLPRVNRSTASVPSILLCARAPPTSRFRIYALPFFFLFSRQMEFRRRGIFKHVSLRTFTAAPLSLVSFIAWLFLRGRWGRRRKILYTFLNILEKEADDRSRINRDAFRKVCLSFLEVDFLEIRICWNKSRQNQVELKIVENGVCKSFWFTGSLWQADGGTKNIVRLGRNRVSGITVPGIFQTMIYLSEEKERNLPPARSADLIFLLVIGVTYRSLTLQCLWINYPSFPSFFFFFSKLCVN